MTTAKLTGPQLEVIALLAEGIEVPVIARTIRGDVDDVHRLIWSACTALDARDRTHLVAKAFRAQLLSTRHTETIHTLRVALDTAERDVTAARREAREARHAATDARNNQTFAEQKLTTARNDLALEVERRQHLERRVAELEAAAAAAVSAEPASDGLVVVPDMPEELAVVGNLADLMSPAPDEDEPDEDEPDDDLPLTERPPAAPEVNQDMSYKAITGEARRSICGACGQGIYGNEPTAWGRGQVLGLIHAACATVTAAAA